MKSRRFVTCPACGHKYQAGISWQQLQAFMLVYTFGLTHQEAAERLNITRQGVSWLLSELFKKYPETRPPKNTPINITRAACFDNIDESKIREKY